MLKRVFFLRDWLQVTSAVKVKTSPHFPFRTEADFHLNIDTMVRTKPAGGDVWPSGGGAATIYRCKHCDYVAETSSGLGGHATMHRGIKRGRVVEEGEGDADDDGEFIAGGGGGAGAGATCGGGADDGAEDEHDDGSASEHEGAILVMTAGAGSTTLTLAMMV